MEQIKYRKTLDVHKNGRQFLLQGFQTADKMSRVIEISLMASGDAIDFPLERIVAMMYVTIPGAKEPSINECTIKDNKVVYNVLPLLKEGITTMQLKLIETSIDGAKSVIASPEFAVEVAKSNVGDDGEILTTTFTAIEDFIAKADAAYESRLERIELSSDCIFRAFYYDGTIYETDVLKKLFLNGNALLSESFAHGNTGVRAGEDTDNSMYYSQVSKSESLNAKAIMEDSKEILEEVKLHGVYTAFSVDFETGRLEYVSPSFKFKVNQGTGNLDAEGQSYTFEEEIHRVVEEWLATNGANLNNLNVIATTHTEEIADLKETTSTHTEELKGIKGTIDNCLPISQVGGDSFFKDYLCKYSGDTLSGVTYANKRYVRAYDGNNANYYLYSIDLQSGDVTKLSDVPLYPSYQFTLDNNGRIYVLTSGTKDSKTFIGVYDYNINYNELVLLNEISLERYYQNGLYSAACDGEYIYMKLSSPGTQGRYYHHMYKLKIADIESLETLSSMYSVTVTTDKGRVLISGNDIVFDDKLLKNGNVDDIVELSFYPIDADDDYLYCNSYTMMVDKDGLKPKLFADYGSESNESHWFIHNNIFYRKLGKYIVKQRLF